MIHVCCTLFAVNIPIWSDMKLQKMIIGASCCFMKHVTFSSFMSNINTSIHQAYWSYICTYTNLLQVVNLRTGQFYMAVMFPQLDVKTGIQINKHCPWDTSLGHASFRISFSQLCVWDFFGAKLAQTWSNTFFYSSEFRENLHKRTRRSMWV